MFPTVVRVVADVMCGWGLARSMEQCKYTFYYTVFFVNNAEIQLFVCVEVVIVQSASAA